MPDPTPTISELAITGPFGGDHCERSYRIVYASGTSPTDTMAWNALVSTAPATWLGTFIQWDLCEVTPVPGSPLVWTGRAVYSRTTAEQVFAEISEDFESIKGTTRGGRQLVTQSLATARYGGAPDEGGAIGYDGEKVQGVEIETGSVEWSITKRVQSVNQTTFLALCDEATGFVNASTFKSRAAGCVKFLGADFEGRMTPSGVETTEDFIYTLYYAHLPVRSITMALATGSVTITKAGWDYLDVRYADAADATTGDVLRKPKYAYVHQVYPRGSLPS